MAARLCLLFLLIVILQEAFGGNLTSNMTQATQLSLRSLGKRYSAYKQKLTWSQALLFCRRRKKQLATISSEDDHLAVRYEVNRLATMWDTNINKFWIGGGVEGSDWVWANSGKQLEYVIWAKGQPKAKNLCLQVRSKEDFSFASGKCEESFMFICQN